MICNLPPQVIRFYSKDQTSIDICLSFVVYHDCDDDNDKGSDSELEIPIKHSAGVLHRRRLQKPRRRLRLFINRINFFLNAQKFYKQNFSSMKSNGSANKIIALFCACEYDVFVILNDSI